MIKRALKFEYSAEGAADFSDILRLFDDAADEDCIQYGAGKATAKTRGLLWVKGREYVEVLTMPERGETVEITTYPCRSAHYIFPRAYELRNSAGELMVRGDCLWILMDEDTRAMADPKRLGAELDGPKQRSLCLKNFLRFAPEDGGAELLSSGSFEFTVSPALIDHNGHMNNKHYVRLCRDFLSGVLSEEKGFSQGFRFTDMLVEYRDEALEGDVVGVQWQLGSSCCLFTGSSAERSYFRLQIGFSGDKRG